MPDILDVIFAFCQEYQTLLILLYNNNLSHILLNKWNTFIPEVHEEIVTTDKPFYQKYNTLNVSYILTFNIGSIHFKLIIATYTKIEIFLISFSLFTQLSQHKSLNIA